MPTGYLSIDIETTGLSPEANQILQVSMIWDKLISYWGMALSVMILMTMRVT